MSITRLLTGTLVVASVVTACHRRPAMDDHSSHATMATPAGGPASQGIAGLPPSGASAPGQLQSSPRHGEWVKVAWEPGSKDSLQAWVVYPSTNRAKSPVVVVVHENTGLITWVRGVADQVAAEGFIAIAPDLSSRARGGPSTTEIPPADRQAIISRITPADRIGGVAAAARYAMSLPSADQRYAVIGYCWGGATVFQHAINGGTTGFVGGVAYYGLPYMTAATAEVPAGPVKDSLAKIKVPIVLLNGSKDARITAAMPSIEATMKLLGKNYMGKSYEGAVHGFLRAQDNPRATRDTVEEAANLAATKDAWPLTVDFLKKNLGVK